MLIRPSDDRVKFPSLKINNSEYGVRCLLGGENGSCFIRYEGFIQGEYSSGNLTNLLQFFEKTMKELPLTVSINLEDKLEKRDDAHKLLSVVITSLNKQRWEMGTRLIRAFPQKP